MDETEFSITPLNKSGDNEEIVLQTGETILGRGSFLNIGDKKVSRNHAKLILSDSCLKLESTHVNPCFVKLAKASKPLVIRSGGSVDLDSGDEFSLLQDAHSYRVGRLPHHECKDDINLLLNDESNNEIKSARNGDSSTGHNQQPPTSSNTLIHAKKEADHENTNTKDDSPKKLVKLFPKHKVAVKNSTVSNDTPVKKKRKLPSWMQDLASEVNKGSPTKRRNLDKDETTKCNQIPSTQNPTSTYQYSDCENSDRVLSTDLKFTTKEGSNNSAKQSPIHEQESVVPEKTCLPNHEQECVVPEKTCFVAIAEHDNSESLAAVHELTEHKNEAVPQMVSGENSNNEECDANLGEKTNITPDEVCVHPDRENASTPNTPAVVAAPAREPCAFGSSCYRRNPVHFQELSHPGDADYIAPPPEEDEDDDDRPECEYGLNCYRKNPLHRRQFKHTRRVPPQRTVRQRNNDDDDEESGENDYDLEDSFINDSLSEESVDEEDAEWKPLPKTKKRSQEEGSDFASDSEEIDELINDAKDFARNKKMWKK